MKDFEEDLELLRYVIEDQDWVTSLTMDDYASMGWVTSLSQGKAQTTTNLKERRRLAAQALVEEALEFGFPRGFSRAKVEESLGLHGNPLGQVLSEYIRGEIAPSLTGLQSLENRLAKLVGRAAREIQVAMHDPVGLEDYYQRSTNKEWGYQINRLRPNAPNLQALPVNVLARANDEAGVTSRALLQKLKGKVDRLWNFIEITAGGLPLLPVCYPLSARAKHLAFMVRQGAGAAGILPE